MPFRGEHAARIEEPELFDDFSRQEDEGGDGIDFILGIRTVEDERVSTIQSIRFDSDLHTVDESKTWLADHDFEPILFEPASGEEDEEPEGSEHDEDEDEPKADKHDPEEDKRRKAAGHEDDKKKDKPHGAYELKDIVRARHEWALAGLMMIDRQWLMRAIAAGGRPAGSVIQPKAFHQASGRSAGRIKTIGLFGPMSKTGDFGFFEDGASTTDVRIQIRDAVRDRDVDTIVLVIDSPGGTIGGTQELANEVKQAGLAKPIIAQIVDMGASAAFWVASQAHQIFANEPAMIGSIGTFAVIEDFSGMMEEMKIKIHLVSSGGIKGLGFDGTPVTEELLDDVRENIMGLNELFLDAVAEGRRMPRGRVNELADGRVHLAAKAQALGLIDGVQSLDETLGQIVSERSSGRGREHATMSRLQDQRFAMISAEP